MTRFKWIKQISLLAAVVPCMLLWGEIFTRTLLPQNVDARMNIFRSDPVIGFTYKPDAVTCEKGREYNARYQINSLGLRDREYGVKEKGVFRIMLLGDSFSVSHGMPIEDSLSRQLEQAFQSMADADGLSVKIEVINTSCGGYSPYNYWRAFSRWAPILNPDAVLVGLSPDDYDCSNEHLQYLIDGGETLAAFRGERRPSGGKGSIRRLRKWLSWNSEFYILARNYFYYNDFIGRMNLWLEARADDQNGQLQPYMVPQPESITAAWAKSFSYLQKLKEETTNDGVPLIVLSIPLKMEVDQEAFRQALAASHLQPHQVDVNQPLKVISAFCKEERIPVIDPRQALRLRGAQVPCYFVYDGHWIAEGIRAAAASAAGQWRGLGLPPWDRVSKRANKGTYERVCIVHKEYSPAND
jgi:hypothetical protein